jgi:catechol 2,3-dioxygenase-like lactoylglutathione lyase family enzyme
VCLWSQIQYIHNAKGVVRMDRKFSPGINHIEFWVSNLERSLAFYTPLFQLIAWKRMNEVSFSSGNIEIYFKEVDYSLQKTLGPRHICFQAVDKKTVEDVYQFLQEVNARIIRGPVEVPEYSEGYYTVDFYDPDGYILEVAYTPNMEL